jgi:2-polyprenyl-3-methyl-5-hydroxy-6-metoxy-1,4-benzoquinol methylase
MSSELNDALAPEYAAKRADYFGCERPEMLAFIPASSRKVLDVGCGSGGFGASVRNRTGCEVWGVEPNADCIGKAERNLNKVLHGFFGPELNLPRHYFDCIVFNDVLEHILDTASALQYAGSLLSDGGVIVASIPNIGHFPTVWRLAVRGEWEYKERGILDKTHLRFFTRSSIQRLFEESGFLIQQIQGLNAYFKMEASDRKLWRIYKPLSFIPVAGIRDMRYLQFAVVAKSGGSNPGSTSIAKQQAL